MIAEDIKDFKGFFPANPTPVFQGEGVREDAFRAIFEYDITKKGNFFFISFSLSNSLK